MTQFSLSVVLPVSDAPAALAPTVAECLGLAAQHDLDLEIIIAEMSGDAAAAASADRLAATHSSVAVLRYQRRRGYRRALHDAWGVARGAYVAALDPAGPAGPADLARLLAAAPGHAAVFGYREPAPRNPAARLFAAAVGARLDPTLRDPALGLALLRADLRDLLSPDGPDALALAELFAAARRRGLPVAQVAVSGRPGRAAAPSLSATVAALSRGATADEGRPARGAAVGGILLAACGVWLLRRLRRP